MNVSKAINLVALSFACSFKLSAQNEQVNSDVDIFKLAILQNASLQEAKKRLPEGRLEAVMIDVMTSVELARSFSLFMDLDSSEGSLLQYFKNAIKVEHEKDPFNGVHDVGESGDIDYLQTAQLSEDGQIIITVENTDDTEFAVTFQKLSADFSSATNVTEEVIIPPGGFVYTVHEIGFYKAEFQNPLQILLPAEM
jgi:hypothetical protein